MKRTSEKPLKNDRATGRTKKMEHLSVNYTGIRDGETIIGCNPLQTRGVEIEIQGQVYYPIDECDQTVVRDRFKTFEFFSKMSREERQKWVSDNIKSYKNGNKENHLYDLHNDLRAKFIKIESPYFIEKLGAEVIADLLAREDYMPMREVYELFKPKDKTTKANRHNLVLRPENWMLASIKPKISSYEGGFLLRIDNESDGLVLDYSKKRVFINTEKETLIEAQPYLEEKTAIIYTQNTGLTKEALFNLTDSLLSESERLECKEIEALIKPFPPSLLKSLLQKIVRTKCGVVTHKNIDYAVKPFLLTCLILLMLHPGSFNVNKRRFVSGMESALKRLAIIICEDSFIGDMSSVTLLLVCALIRQRDRTWVPSLFHVKRFFQVALEAHDSVTMLDYRTDERHIRVIQDPLERPSDYILNYILLEAIGSMKGDINFFSHLAITKEQITHSYIRKDHQIIKMPLIHCIDQHSFTGIAHFMPFDENTERDRVAPFKPLFSKIWNEVGSLNGRRDFERIIAMGESIFVNEVRFAQACIFTQKFCDKPTVRIMDNTATIQRHKFSYSIDEAWISGMVGPIVVKIGKPAISTIIVIRTDDIMEMVAIRNPKNARSGGANDLAVDLTPEEKEEAIEAAKKLLRLGYPLKHVPSALDLFKGAKVRLVDEVTTDIEKKYVVQLAGSNKEIDWTEAVNIRASFPEFESPVDGDSDSYQEWLSAALLSERVDGSGCIAIDGFASFEKVLERYSIGVIKRLYVYLSNYRPIVKLYDISRDGSATKLDVSLLDIGVNHILCAICVLFPACLELSKNTGCFKVLYGPLLWFIRQLVKDRIDALHMEVEEEEEENDTEKKGNYWLPITGDEQTALFQHQRDCLAEMIKKNDNNKRGHELLLTVGMGKTGICMSFIQHLVANRRMPKYCVYSCPPSAIGNAKSEFDRFKIPHCDVVSQKGTKKSVTYRDNTLEPFKINIVAHDHMRRPCVYSQLKEKATEIFFVIDEFHLVTSSETIRSSIALEIARLSYDFVAMTGTIVRNDNPGELIQWLELIVDFYVTSDNYLAAFGALISKKASTGVSIKYDEVQCEFTEKEETAYNAVVPVRLGGNASELDFRKALQICYECTDRAIVKKVCHYVIEETEIVFVLAQNKAHQENLKNLIIAGSDGEIQERHVFLIDKDNTIILKPETQTVYKVVITTLLHVTGYTLTKCRIAISSVYMSNESTRSQYEGRLDRIGQLADEITIVTLHCGILSYLLANYKRARSFAHALRQFADESNIDYHDMIIGS